MEQNDVTVTADVKPLRVDRRRTLLTTTCADRRAVYAKYVYSASTGWDKVPDKTTLSFKDTEFSYKTAYTGRSEHLCQKNQLDPFTRFDRTPTCDRQNYTQAHSYNTAPRGYKGNAISRIAKQRRDSEINSAQWKCKKTTGCASDISTSYPTCHPCATG